MSALTKECEEDARKKTVKTCKAGFQAEKCLNFCWHFRILANGNTQVPLLKPASFDNSRKLTFIKGVTYTQVEIADDEDDEFYPWYFTTYPIEDY